MPDRKLIAATALGGLLVLTCGLVAIFRFTRPRAANVKVGPSGAASLSPAPTTTRPLLVGTPEALSPTLPTYLVVDKSYSRQDDGIRVNGLVKTRDANFIDKDFTFDVWFTPERADQAEAVLAGIGGSGDPDSDDHSSVSLAIEPPSDRGSAVTVLTSRWEGGKAGVIRQEGMLMARLRKRRGQIDFAVGTEIDGNFVADASAAAADIHDLDKSLNSKNSYLFFGHRHARGPGDGRVTFNKVRLAIDTQIIAATGDASNRAVAGSCDPHELATSLPALFRAATPYATTRDGIRFQGFIKTRAADFIDRDFTLDVWFTPETTEEGEAVMVGIGGSGDPDSDDHTSVSLVADPPGEHGSKVTVVTSRWEGGRAGVVHEEGIRIARLQKRGEQINFAIGADVDGEFVPDASATVADIHDLDKSLNDRNSYLFFGHRHARGAGDGHVTFNKLRLDMGEPVAAPISNAGAAARVTRLAVSLPPFLRATVPYATNKDGILLEEIVKTKASDFIDKDFIFDVWFTPEPNDNAEAVMIGIGGSGDPDSDDRTCVSLVIAPPSERGSEVSVISADRWKGQNAGMIRSGGPFIGRIEKKGDQMKFEVGVEVKGKFNSVASGAVANIRELAPVLNDRNTHLFFGHRHARGKGDGHITFNQVRLQMANVDKVRNWVPPLPK